VVHRVQHMRHEQVPLDEVVSAADGRMMADWRCHGGEHAFWIYADFGPIPMRRKIWDVKKWRGLAAPRLLYSAPLKLPAPKTCSSSSNCSLKSPSRVVRCGASSCGGCTTI